MSAPAILTAAVPGMAQGVVQEPDPLPGLLLLGGVVVAVVQWRRRRRRRRRALEPEPRDATHSRSGRWSARRLWAPAPVLLFLSAYIAEGFSGATPALLLFNPLVLAYFVVFYGSGALLIRETTLAWGKGWPTRLALGAAYGICEEGLTTKVFFDLERTDLGAQMQYGTWLGVHWPYTFHLIVYHAIFSISIPILITSMLFPDRAGTPWVRRRTLPVLGALFVGGIVLGSVTLYDFTPSPWHYLGGVVAAALLIALARVLPRRLDAPGPTRLATPKRLAVFGFWITAVTWVVSYLFAAWGVPPGVTLATEVALLLLGGWRTLRLTDNARTWSEYHQFSLVAGMLSFFILGAFLLEALGIRGQSLMGIAGAGWILLLRRRLRARAHPGAAELAGTLATPGLP